MKITHLPDNERVREFGLKTTVFFEGVIGLF